MSAEYQKSDIPWQLYQLGQRFSQWLEWQMSKTDLDVDFPRLNWLTLELLQKIGQVIFWILIICLGYWLIRGILSIINNYVLTLEPQAATPAKKPLIPKLKVSQWLEKSQQYSKIHNYREACFCLYYATLELLDEHQLVPQQESRTDGEYSYIVANFPQSQAYRTILDIHQSLCFDTVEASAKTWQNCQQAYQKIIQIKIR